MTKRAFLFAGQGAQKLGMASDLYATYPVVKETFDTASRILGYDLRELIDVIIPANDDAIRAVKLITSKMAIAIWML